MSDDQVLRLLEEIRDLQREQAERQRQSLALQERAVANQFESVAKQKEAIDTQRLLIRRLIPPLLAALAVVFILLILGMLRAV